MSDVRFITLCDASPPYVTLPDWGHAPQRVIASENVVLPTHVNVSFTDIPTDVKFVMSIAIGENHITILTTLQCSSGQIGQV